MAAAMTSRAAASMAGQYETFLHVTDEASLLDAIRCCWASLDSPRTRAYLGEHGIQRQHAVARVRHGSGRP